MGVQPQTGALSGQAAELRHFLLDGRDDDQPISVGAGHDVTIAELAGLVAEVVGDDGKLLLTSQMVCQDPTHRRSELRTIGFLDQQADYRSGEH